MAIQTHMFIMFKIFIMFIMFKVFKMFIMFMSRRQSHLCCCRERTPVPTGFYTEKLYRHDWEV